MDSFYGGKQGASFVIKGRFNYISPEKETYQIALENLRAEGKSEEEAKAILKPLTMTECFEDSTYKDVWYNEYCIIDTPNKSDRENGMVFRRTLKGPSEDKYGAGGYAEYIGQIVGPAGPASSIDLSNVQNVWEKWKNLDIGPYDILEYVGDNGQIYHKKFNEIDLKVFHTLDPDTINWIPGSTIIDEEAEEEADKYVKDLKYNWYQFVEGDEEDALLAKTYIGFDIPYYEADFYAGDSLNYAELPVLQKTLDAPFYDQYHLDVPRGITGAYFSNFRRITVGDNQDIYKITGIQYNPSEDTYTFDETEKEINLVGKDIWVCTFYWNYIDKTPQDGIPHREAKVRTFDEDYPLYIGTVKDIRNITDIVADGTFTVEYTDNTSKTYNQALSWITKIEIDQDSNLKFTANNEKLILPQPFNLRTIKDIKLNGDINANNFSDSRKIQIKYSDDNINYLSIGDEINYVQEMYYYKPEDNIPADIDATQVEVYHLYILFNAPSKRTPQDGRVWKILKPDTLPGVYWLDLGYMRQIDQGLMVHTEFIADGATSEVDAVDWMDDHYSAGLNNKDAGKLACVKIDDGTVFVMAYDYDPSHNRKWFSLGTLSSVIIDSVIGDELVLANIPGDIILASTATYFNTFTEPQNKPAMSTPWTVTN